LVSGPDNCGDCGNSADRAIVLTDRKSAVWPRDLDRRYRCCVSNLAAQKHSDNHRTIRHVAKQTRRKLTIFHRHHPDLDRASAAKAVVGAGDVTAKELRSCV